MTNEADIGRSLPAPTAKTSRLKSCVLIAALLCGVLVSSVVLSSARHRPDKMILLIILSLGGLILTSGALVLRLYNLKPGLLITFLLGDVVLLGGVFMLSLFVAPTFLSHLFHSTVYGWLALLLAGVVLILSKFVKILRKNASARSRSNLGELE